LIRKNINGTFTVDIRQGRNKRHQKCCRIRTEAVHERYLLNEIDQGKVWQPKNYQQRANLSK
jgi:hypothetical protein